MKRQPRWVPAWVETDLTVAGAIVAEAILWAGTLLRVTRPEAPWQSPCDPSGSGWAFGNDRPPKKSPVVPI